MAASAKGIRAGRAYVEFFADDSKFQQGVKRISRNLKAFSLSVGKIGAVFTGVGSILSSAFVPATKAASDMEEAMAKFRATFGDQSDDTLKWAENFSKTIGRAKIDTVTGLATFQSFFLGLGKGSKEAAELSKMMQSLSVDFAAFHNIADDEAMQRFISAMSGSTEVMDKFGVNLKVGALEPIVKQMFGVDYHDATEAQKTMARMAEIRNRMAHQGAIGSAVRESGSYANQIKALGASIKNFWEAVGTAVLPVVTKYVSLISKGITFVADFVTENQGLVKMIAVIGTVAAGAGAAILTIAGILWGAGAAMAAMSTALTALGTVVGAVATPMGAVAVALAGVVAWAFASGNAIEWLGTLFKPLYEHAAEVFNAIKTAISGGDWGAAAEVLWTSLKLAWLKGTTKLSGIWNGFVKVAADMFIKLSATISRVWAETARFIADAFSLIITPVRQAMQHAETAVSKILMRVLAKASGMSPAMAEAFLQKADAGIDVAHDAGMSKISDDRDQSILDRERETKRKIDEINRQEAGALETNQEDLDRKIADSQAELKKAMDDYRKARNEANSTVTDPKKNPFGGFNMPDVSMGTGGGVGGHGTFGMYASREFGTNSVSGKLDTMNDHLGKIEKNTKKSGATVQ
ncbi:hypothetical protein [Planctomicrobium sp. SH664]|uniref:hypothetical protein n=1 Tax=Planctomicrobium sp. SH664 TaxID=3448125 RepID=UPI003F5BAA49